MNAFERRLTGVHNARRPLLLQEGMKWTSISVTPEDAELLAARKFSVEQIARLFRVPPPVIGDLEHGTYSNVTELGRWFHQHTIAPWLTRWEATIMRQLFTDEGRRNHVVGQPQGSARTVAEAPRATAVPFVAVPISPSGVDWRIGWGGVFAHCPSADKRPTPTSNTPKSLQGGSR